MPPDAAGPAARHHVLAVVDGDGAADGVLEAARRLAPAAGLPLRVAHAIADVRPTVVEAVAAPPPAPRVPLTRAPLSVETVEEISRRTRADGWRLLAELGVAEADAEVLDGPAVDALLGRLVRRRPWAVVTGSRGRGPRRAALLGSVSRTLMREAPCPVVVVSPGVRSQFGGGPLVCGLDGATPRADALLVTAATFADRLRRELVLAHVQPVGGNRHATEAELRAARGLLGRRHVTLEVREGRPAAQLRALARSFEADALVVATRGRSDVRTLLGGSVAGELAASSPCPVVIAPPP